MHVSPHLWGFHSPDILKFLLVRFIPTHVGLTRVTSLDKYRQLGSSPRTWGLLQQPGAEQGHLRFIPTHVGLTVGAYVVMRHDLRFIPTHVGLTIPKNAKNPCIVVHPHARGVYFSVRAMVVVETGSSPRTWGLLIRQAAHLGQLRFIPTHVGFTAGRC